MKTTTITTEKTIADDPQAAIEWLKTEYPNGTDLVYVDRGDSYDENLDRLQKILKGDWDDLDEDYNGQVDAQHESVEQGIANFKKENEIEELSDEISQAISDWLYEHDTSNPTEDLLKNTSYQLCFLETEDYANEGNDPAEVAEMVKKYAKTPEQKKEIKTAFREQTYDAPISFYFYADPNDIFNAINSSAKYILVSGAYFANIDRVQGTNWLGESAVFDLVIPREEFIKNFRLDEASGAGYSWQEIAGGYGYDEAAISGLDEPKENAILMKPETSESVAREEKLQKHWNKTKKCTFGDLNQGRHSGKLEYSNGSPCGTHCSECGTFWID